VWPLLDERTPWLMSANEARSAGRGGIAEVSRGYGHETIVKLTSRTATTKCLGVGCRLDRRQYPTGRTVTDEETQRVNLERRKFYGKWNYVIRPRASWV
jgi:hypothetical protein